MTAFWHDIRMLHTTANVLMMAACAALLLTALGWVAQRPAFDLAEVEVVSADGLPFRRVTLWGLRGSELSRFDGNFFTVDLHRVRRAFETIPWVRQAEVRRVWPNHLRVTLEEREPLALWEGGGLVDVHGEWFDPAPQRPATYAGASNVRLAGPEGTQSAVRERYVELKRELAPLGLEPVAVRVNERMAWSATLQNGLELKLGREADVSLRERLARWIAVHRQLAGRLGDGAQVVDLRYPNGFAVRAPSAFAAAARTNNRAARDTTGARAAHQAP